MVSIQEIGSGWFILDSETNANNSQRMSLHFVLMQATMRGTGLRAAVQLVKMIAEESAEFPTTLGAETHA